MQPCEDSSSPNLVSAFCPGWRILDGYLNIRSPALHPKHTTSFLALFLGLGGSIFPGGSASAQSSSARSAQAEVPGPCSRRTPLVISEIMYHPPIRADSNNLEFVEVFNSQPWPEDVSGFELAGAVKYTFPAGTLLPAQGVMVVAADPVAIGSEYGITNILGPYSGRLENGSEKLRLLNRSGAV